MRKAGSLITQSVQGQPSVARGDSIVIENIPIKVGTGESGAAGVPTTMQANLEVPAHQQVGFRRPIRVMSGQRIVLGTDSALVGY